MGKFEAFYKAKAKRSTNRLLKEHKLEVYWDSDYYKEIQINELTTKDSSHGCLCYCGICMG